MSSEEKREVKVINVPRKKKNKKKKPLVTPSFIIRISMIVCFVICILLLSSPFLSAKLYITEDLEITTSVSEAYRKPATQEMLDNAAKELQTALDSLEKVAKSAEENSTSAESASNVGLDSANYKWSYAVPHGVDAKPLAELIEKARNINRRDYTSESVERLNRSQLNAQKILCASVLVEQSVMQMALGGAIGESLGTVKNLGNTISHSFFAFLLGTVPLTCFIILCFDKRSHLKHIICMIGAIACLAVIFGLLYPHVGMGAVISIIVYIIIFLLNLASIYAKQQEDYIVKHPEKEPEFTEKHPHFVKALVNYKAFVKYAAEPDTKPKRKKKK